MSLNADELIGYRLGDYQLERVLGSGGAGIVYLASRLDQPDDQVAIKVLMPPTLNTREQDEFRRRFLREAEILTSLRHDHIVPVLSVGEDQPHRFVYMVMSYIGAGTLADRLDQGTLPLSQMMSYVAQLADALDYAHEHHIIHRDLKPANVLLDEHDQVYLADFGIAKLLDQDATTITNVNQAIGTPGYMAPEQIAGQMASAATDVYGLGILAYQMVAGRLPFATASLATTVLQIVSEQPASPREFRAELPQPAAEVILRAIAKTPEQRFASASAFARALDRGLQNKPMTPSPQTILGYMPVAEGESSQSDAAPAAWISPERRRRRPVWVALAAGVLVLAVLVGIAGTRVFPHFGTLHSLGGSTPQPVLIATQNAVPTGTSVPNATHTPSISTPASTHVPNGTVPPTLPTATRTPPAGTSGKLTSNITSPVTMHYDTKNLTHCYFDSLEDPTLKNIGTQTLTWSPSYTISSGANVTLSFSPASGTLAPNQSVPVTLTGTASFGATITVTYSWSSGKVIETINCPNVIQ
jgi:serine/threonine protein kinase